MAMSVSMPSRIRMMNVSIMALENPFGDLHAWDARNVRFQMNFASTLADYA
jgi:hypothetical protein